MIRFAKTRLALGFAACTGLLAGRAAGSTSEPCLSPKIHVVLPEGPAWQTATAELTERLRALPDLDKCARVVARPSGNGVLLEITTSDGRQAVRQVASVPELLRAAEALLVLPPEPPPKQSSPSKSELPPVEHRANVTPPTTTHVELGAGGSLRLGGGPVYAGGGVAGFAQFALEGWLLAVSARWDIADVINEPTAMDFYMQSSAVGVSIGHRLELAGVHLDTLLGPTIVLESQDADDVDREVHGASADFRLALAVRVSGPRSSSIRAFASSDFEGSPARIHSQKTLDRVLPPLPWWSSGLAVGILWGAR
jgi:hypothetical protein